MPTCHVCDRIRRETGAMLTIEQGIITSRETPLPLALRLFAAFLGIGIGTVIPLAWLANAQAQTRAPVLVLLAVVVLVSVVFGAFLIFLSLSSRTEMRIDPAQPMVLRIRRGPILNDRTEIPRGCFGTPVVTMRDSEDGPFPVLTLPVQGRRRIQLAGFDSRAEAEAWRDLIARALSG